MIVLPDTEDRTIVSSFAWTKRDGRTDRQTDRQTDLLWILQRYELRAMRTRCNKFYRPVLRSADNEQMVYSKMSAAAMDRAEPHFGRTY